MAWPPAGSALGEILLYYWLLWFLLVVGPVAAWIAIYYLWLKRRWDPHFRAVRGGLKRDDRMENFDGDDGSSQGHQFEKRAV